MDTMNFVTTSAKYKHLSFEHYEFIIRVTHQELSASAAFHKRSTYRKISNFSKLDKAKDFLDLVIREVKSNKLSSIDETLNRLVLHHPAKKRYV